MEIRLFKYYDFNYPCANVNLICIIIKCVVYGRVVNVCVARAPVHVVTGSAGCKEGRDHFRRSSPAWSAFRSQDYGLTRLQANRTHVAIEQVSADLHGEVIDSFCLVKDKHMRFKRL